MFLSQISQLQEEMNKETEHRADLAKTMQKTTNARQHERLEDGIHKSDEKIQALALMLLHYCSGLQACLAMEDPEDQEHPAFSTGSSAWYVHMCSGLLDFFCTPNTGYNFLRVSGSCE